MNTCIISCGPSAKLYEKRTDDYDLVFGVNYAVKYYQCDWWVFQDVDQLTEYKPLGNPKIWTIHQANYLTKKTNIPFKTNWFDLGVVPFWFWPSIWTAHTALMVAYKLGATSIDCYGFDMAGEDDITGIGTEERRKARSIGMGRWARERLDIDRMINWLPIPVKFIKE